MTFDGNDPSANTDDDDDAIAPSAEVASEPIRGKTVLVQTLTAMFQNYTRYTSGIDRIKGDMIDLVDPAGASHHEVFEFRVSNAPNDWGEAVATVEVLVRPGLSVSRSDLATIIWNDNVI